MNSKRLPTLLAAALTLSIAAPAANARAKAASNSKTMAAA